MEKLENLNKRILRFILGDFLFNNVNCVSLYNIRVHNMMVIFYKSLFLSKYSIYISNSINYKENTKEINV